MSALQTRQIGLAPDERGRDRPLEIVYECEVARKPSLFVEQWSAPNSWVSLGLDVVILSLWVYVIGGAVLHLW